MQGLCLLFELKKNPNKAATCQGMCQLLLANILSRGLGPVVVVTDLVDEWQLLWMDGNNIMSNAFSGRGIAVDSIRALVKQVGPLHISVLVMPCWVPQ